jgi:Mg2+ and Co2+ transporter CorA
MPWYQLDDANDPRLDELARQYKLHPLHIEDARTQDESVKVSIANQCSMGISYTVPNTKKEGPAPDGSRP